MTDAPGGMVERLARAIAKGLGDDFDHAFVTKSEWNTARGHKGGRDRDINEPLQADYLDAARAALKAMREPTEEMLDAACEAGPDTNQGEFNYAHATWVYHAMIDAALRQSAMQELADQAQQEGMGY